MKRVVQKQGVVLQVLKSILSPSIGLHWIELTLDGKALRILTADKNQKMCYYYNTESISSFDKPGIYNVL